MMSSKKSAGYVCATIGIVFAVGGGCMVGDEEAAGGGGQNEVEEEVYSVQLVDLNRGGIIVYDGYETATERRQRVVDREFGQSADAIAKSDPCFLLGENLLELYAAPNLGGGRICFYGTGVADLNNYCLLSCLSSGGCCNTWAGDVQSFKTGSYDARFGDLAHSSTDLCCQGACTAHEDGETVNDASACEEDTQYVDRGTSVTCTTCVE